MIQLTNVVCAVDFSEFSHRAVNYAAAIAGWYEARLTVAHVFPPSPVPDLTPDIEARVERDRVLGELKKFTASVPPDLPIQLCARPGLTIARNIVALADEVHADLLVLGSHGRSGFDRLLLGSVSEKVIRLATCPTLVVPRRAGDAPNGPVEFHRILCAVDFSDASLRALEHAMTMAEESGAELKVLHVYNVPPDLSPGAASSPIVAAELEADRRRLEQLVPEDVKTYCTVRCDVRQGAVHREILSAADEQRADLIVMGVHGRGALDVMMFGSNTARVARLATCPVLIVNRV